MAAGRVQLGVFYFMAFLVATSQGGIQALGRSYFGKLIPKEQSGESRYGVLSLTVLFGVGGILLAVAGRSERQGKGAA